MNQFEIYSLLFTDSLVGNLVISFESELVIHSMKMFGIYNNWLMLLVATSASIIATSINFLCGTILLNIFYCSKDEQNILKHNKSLNQFYLKYNIVLLSLIIFPFWGNIIPLLAGFLKINLIRVLAISGLMKLCYYTYILLL